MHKSSKGSVQNFPGAVNPQQLIVLTHEDLKKVVSQAVSETLSITRTPVKPKPESPIITIKEATELLHLSKKSIYGLINKRRIPHMKRAKRLYFDRNELIEWLKSSKKEAVNWKGGYQ